MAGNSNSGKRKDKIFNTALMLELTDGGDARGIRAIARRLINSALDDKDPVQAIKEIADRLDGKPAQALIGGEEDDLAIKVAHIIRLCGPND